jgi:hypothetical protein
MKYQYKQQEYIYKYLSKLSQFQNYLSSSLYYSKEKYKFPSKKLWHSSFEVTFILNVLRQSLERWPTN